MDLSVSSLVDTSPANSQAYSTSFQSFDSITSATTLDLLNNIQTISKDNVSDPDQETTPGLPLPSHALFANKKRERDECLPSSSDAPLFSSDDLPASSAENYTRHRHKRQHRRAWYEEEDKCVEHVIRRSPVKTPRAKGPFTRNYDSGIWLGSDESADYERGDPPDPFDKGLSIKVRLSMGFSSFADLASGHVLSAYVCIYLLT